MQPWFVRTVTCGFETGPRHSAQAPFGSCRAPARLTAGRADDRPVSISTPNTRTSKTCRDDLSSPETAPDYGPQGERCDSRRNRRFHRLGLCDELVPRHPMGWSRLRRRRPCDRTGPTGARPAHLARPWLPAGASISTTEWGGFLGTEGLDDRACSSSKSTDLRTSPAV